MISDSTDSTDVPPFRRKRPKRARTLIISVIILIIVAIGSYFFRFGATYIRPGDFATHVPIIYHGLAIDRGNIEYWHQTADAPAPDATGFAAITLNADLNKYSGFACGMAPSTSEHLQERYTSLLGTLGFYHYHPESFDARAPYGQRSSIDAWLFPLWLIAIVLWLPVAIRIRRSFRLKN